MRMKINCLRSQIFIRSSYSRKEGYNMKKQNATDAYVAVIAEISAKLDAIKAQAVDNLFLKR